MRQFLHLTLDEAKQIIADHVNSKLHGLTKPVKAEDVDFELENIGEYADDGQYIADVCVETHI